MPIYIFKRPLYLVYGKWVVERQEWQQIFDREATALSRQETMVVRLGRMIVLKIERVGWIKNVYRRQNQWGFLIDDM